ncbi:LysR family transcriptional regulator [Catenovulum agarivorans DS-2]|uniref:LysR family transcriptional regulator n=1 Tax=Catenovulum agarivorans DS-2 TaxID=1328313 RepID=W7QW30_9ALTE|nr:LysR family transcriptional regulator [Catenovulum agarivorans]EWH11953.1 LysR family transcriptional regulator [Catenovulum agarivorans DS-2]
MQADDLILFSQVVELGSFSKAAEQNNLTNSVVSKRIARLEADLGVQLLYRTTRKLTVTEAGSILAVRAKTVSQATTEALNSVTGIGEEVTGHIKMSVPTISGELLLAQAVSEFCAQNSKLSIHMSMDNHFVDLINDRYDLAIRTGKLEDSSLIAKHIIDSQWVVCTSRQYIKQYGAPKTPQQLQQHNCLRYSYQTTGASEWEFKSDNGHYFVHVDGAFSTNNASALRKAVMAGHGIAYVPRCLVYPDLSNGKLIELFPNLVGKTLGVYAVYPFTKHQPTKIKRLVEHISQAYLNMSHYFIAEQLQS